MSKYVHIDTVQKNSQMLYDASLYFFSSVDDILISGLYVSLTFSIALNEENQKSVFFPDV